MDDRNEITRGERIRFLNQFEVYDFRYFIKPRLKREVPQLSLWRTQFAVVNRYGGDHGPSGMVVDMVFHNGGNQEITVIVKDDIFFDFINGKTNVVQFYNDLADYLVAELCAIKNILDSDGSTYE